jgi:outer membrane protein assembly factor BamA
MAALFVEAFALVEVARANQVATSPPVATSAPASERIADIQIHGNNVTPDAEVLALAAVARGDPFATDTLDEVRRRLLASRRFEDVTVLKRYASIADPSQITLVILIDEHAVRIQPGPGGAAEGAVRLARRRLWGAGMILPILEAEDGYGLTYGATLAFPGVAGERSRLVFPLSWGGRKRAGAEFDQPLAAGPIGRFAVGTSLERRRNPAFVQDDDRARVWGRVETRVRWNLRVGTTAALERVSFVSRRDTWKSAAADVTWDTRHDPIFPRNAVYATASRTRLVGGPGGPINRDRIDLRGYVGLIASPVVVVRLERDTADRVLPPYFKSLLGGWSNLRGFSAGSFADDNRVTTSVELRVPISSPLSVSKAGISVFADRGKVYDHGSSFADAPWHTGMGAGVWLTAAVVRAGVSVARPRRGDTRVNVSLGIEY